MEPARSAPRTAVNPPDAPFESTMDSLAFKLTYGLAYSAACYLSNSASL